MTEILTRNGVSQKIAHLGSTEIKKKTVNLDLRLSKNIFKNKVKECFVPI